MVNRTKCAYLNFAHTSTHLHYVLLWTQRHIDDKSSIATVFWHYQWIFSHTVFITDNLNERFLNRTEPYFIYTNKFILYFSVIFVSFFQNQSFARNDRFFFGSSNRHQDFNTINFNRLIVISMKHSCWNHHQIQILLYNFVVVEKNGWLCVVCYCCCCVNSNILYR